MLRVALTGGMGSGKSVAATVFRELGCFVSQSDEVARGMMRPGHEVHARIVDAFGPSVVQADGTLDRAALAKLAFADGRAEELNAIIHPAVIAHQAAWMQAVGETHPRAVAMVESALVFETRHGSATGESTAPWRTRFDRIVLVTAPEPLRLDRYLARIGVSEGAERDRAEQDARGRMRAQMPDAEKAALSDFVLVNDSTLVALRAGVERVWKQLRQEADDRAEEAM